MSVGPYVFGPDRRDLWVASSSNLTDKLKHFLPRLRKAIPNLTDVFLPEEALNMHRKQVKEAGFFPHTYVVARDRSAKAFATAALVARAMQGTGALDLNFEGGSITDSTMARYIEDTVAEIRKTNPFLPLRINVVPWKGMFLPLRLIRDDPKLFVTAQTYGGNMDILYAADEVKQDLIYNGIPVDKANVMHAVMCRTDLSKPRQITLPQVRGKGGFYIDDLLLDAGLLP